MTERNRINTESMNISGERLNALKDLFPEVFVEGKIDYEKLRLLLGDDVQSGKERFQFTWSGKRDAMAAAQPPSRASLAPVREESVNFDTTRNVFIEGDNLEALKLLLRPYFRKVKMIYIDPPYNTGNDFIYPDDYSDPLGAYLQYTDQADENGNRTSSNTEKNGRYHSAWLSMMYPRLFLARQLLREDGVIFVSIDDHEVHHLRMLMDEIFGEHNFVANIVWQRKYGPANDARQISQTHEHIIVYARETTLWTPILLPRTDEQLADYKNPDSDPRGVWRVSDLSARTATAGTVYPINTPTGRTILPPESRSWIVSQSRFQQLKADGRIYFGVDGNGRPMEKKFLSEVREGITPQTWWDRQFSGDTKTARYEVKELFPENLFDTPKPADLIKRMLQIASVGHSNDIILDFFSGSGTTAHAVLEQNIEDSGNRRFILVQLPEPTNNPTYPTIAEIGKERIRRVIARIQESQNGKLMSDAMPDLGFRVFRLEGSHMPDSPQNQIALFSRHDLDAVIYEAALGEGFTLETNAEAIPGLESHVYRITDPTLNASFYFCADTVVPPDLDRQLGLGQQDTLILLDSALTDTMAANFALRVQLKTL